MFVNLGIPDTSVQRVHRLVDRFRKHPLLRRLGLGVSSGPGGYRIASTRETGIWVEIRREMQSKERTVLERLRSLLEAGPIGCQEVAQFLGVSDRSARRVLSEAVRAGSLEQVGAGPATRYKLVL